MEHNTDNTKKLYIKTYGCQMNIYDSQKMAALLKPHGFAITERVEDADMTILNTCHIREKASEKAYSDLGRISIHKNKRRENGKDMVIVLAGCTAQAEGEEIARRSSAVDIIVGPQSYHNIPILLEDIKRNKSWAINLDFDENTKFDYIEPVESKLSAFLSIQEGCDKFCHFCVVPYTRGAEISRPAVDIYREAIMLSSQGTSEITLLGQNVSGYKGKGIDNTTWSIGKLIKEVAKIDQIKRIRYTTSHPMDMVKDNQELFDAHANEEKLMPYIHLPIQSGSDKVLKLMNRKHTAKEYLDIIEKFRKARPDVVFSSDFIVGYPGETDADFEQTLDIVREVQYTASYSFAYSIRPGTPAALAEQVPEEVKKQRLQELQSLLKMQQLAFNDKQLGKVVDVLIEKAGKIPGQMVGKSPYLQSVVCQGDDSLIGKFVKIKVHDSTQSSLIGEIV